MGSLEPPFPVLGVNRRHPMPTRVSDAALSLPARGRRGGCGCPVAVHLAVGYHHVDFTGTTHVYTVGFSAFAAVVAAVGLTAIGARRGDTRTMVVGTAFAVMAGLLALHGFSTPGVWFGNNGVVAITGGATLPAGAIVLVFSVLPLPRVLRNVLPFLLVEAVLLAVILALGISALVWPSLLPPVPAPAGATRSRSSPSACSPSRS